MNKKNCLRILTVFVCLMLVCLCALAEECTHTSRTVMDFGWRDATYVDNGDGKTHTVTYVDPFEFWICDL